MCKTRINKSKLVEVHSAHRVKRGNSKREKTMGTESPLYNLRNIQEKIGLQHSSDRVYQTSQGS